MMTVAGRSARRGDGQGGAGARRRALPARVSRTAARCGLSVWRHHHRESVVGRPEGAQPPNTPGGNTTRGETPHGETHPPTHDVSCVSTGSRIWANLFSMGVIFVLVQLQSALGLANRRGRHIDTNTCIKQTARIHQFIHPCIDPSQTSSY